MEATRDAFTSVPSDRRCCFFGSQFHCGVRGHDRLGQSNNPMQGGLGLLYQQWVFGFLSGVSYDGPSHDPLKGMDAPSIMQWLGDYCQRNPTVNIAAAASAFAQAHHP